MLIIEESTTQYFDELSLRLGAEGIHSKQTALGTLRVYHEGQPVCDVIFGGYVYRELYYLDTPEANALYHRTTEISGMVQEYMQAMENAPPVPAKGLDPADGFLLLADYGDCVLAGQKTRLGCQFVTWSWDPRHEYVVHGHYMGNDYQAAKTDFAIRSGLVDSYRLFTTQQMAEVYHYIHETLDSNFDLTPERRRTLEEFTEQIEHSVPDLEKLVNQSNEQEMNISM